MVKSKELQLKNELEFFLGKELDDLKKTIDRKSKIFIPKECVHNSLQRALGVCFFLQQLGLDYETINTIYNKFKSKAEELL